MKGTKAATMLVALAMVASPLAASALEPGGTFTDDNGNPHEGFIEAIAAAGITLGCDASGTLYCPSADVSRAQMASFLARSLDLPATGEDYFTDDDGNPHEDNINAVAEAGISLGTGNQRFDPSASVTRAQMASFLARALDGLAEATLDYFTDDDGNSHEDNINIVAANDITLGCDASGSLYCPLDAVRRDQMASFLGRALGLEEVEVPPGWPTDGSPLTEDEARTLFSLYFEGEDIETAVRMAECESNLNPTAVNASGLHGGLLQHAFSAWDERAVSAGWAGASIFDPEANTAVTAWLVDDWGWEAHWSCY